MTLQSDKLLRIQLEEEKETLLLTLYAKALDSQSSNPILNDTKARRLMNRIDYDFDRLDRFSNNHLMVIRAKQLDLWLEEFLSTNTEATVLNLGCGLDTRCSRIRANERVSWYDLDYPEVIHLRERFYSNQTGYEMIPSSVMALNWLEKIPNNKPVMIIAEGLLEYLTVQEVKTLLNQLTDHFTHGHIAFDIMNNFAIQSGKAVLKKNTGATHKWAVDNVKEVDQLNEKLHRIATCSALKSKYIRHLSLKERMIYKTLSIFPSFRDMIRILLYKF